MADGNEGLATSGESSVDVWPVDVLLANGDDGSAIDDDVVSPFELGLDALRAHPASGAAGEVLRSGRRWSVLPLAVAAAAAALFAAVFSVADEGPIRGEGGRVPAAQGSAPSTQRMHGGRPDGASVSPTTVETKTRKRTSGPGKDTPLAPAPGDGPAPPATSPQPTVVVPGVVEATVDLPGGSKATITLPGLPPVSVETPPVALPQLRLGGPK